MIVRILVPLAMILVLAGCQKRGAEHTDSSPEAAADGADVHHDMHSDMGHMHGDMAGMDMPADDAAGHMPSMEGEPGPPIESGQRRALGAPLDADASENALSVSELMGQCLDTGESCVVSSQIGASCTHSGCWFTLPSPDSHDLVLVEVKNDAFHMPINAAGTHAVARGTLTKADFTQAQTYYFQKETAKALDLAAPDKAHAPTSAYIFITDGVVVSKADDADASDADTGDGHAGHAPHAMGH